VSEVWNNTADWLERRRALDGRSIGFVPTMGALHRGHAALVEHCRRENDVVVVSIFVNPTQFNDPRDLERYPRTMAEDLALLERLGADHVLAPRAQDVYPNGYGIRLEPDESLRVLEAVQRPGFLQGVLTVVLKLLNLVRADRAYFGEKDYQQLTAIEALVREFFIPTKIVPCATVREESGLAMSSRNALLSAEARENAAHLHRALVSARDVEEARTMIDKHGFRVEYVEERWGRRLAAAFLDGIRLIDNVPMAEIERS
jgi:pantoate--beta-alanine ligase